MGQALPNVTDVKLETPTPHEESVTDTWKPTQRKMLEPSQFKIANASDANKKGGILNNLLHTVVAKCGRQQNDFAKCATWCEASCNVGGLGNAFCCKGGTLRSDACHGCEFCHKYDLAFNLHKYQGEIFAQAQSTNANSLVDVERYAQEPAPGLILKVGIGFGSFIGGDLAVGIAFGASSPFVQLLYSVGLGVSDSALEGGISFSLDFAPSNWQCEFGFGVGGNIQLEPLGLFIGPGTLADVIVNAAVGPQLSFACSGPLSDCNQFCSAGVAIDVGLEALDITLTVPVDFSITLAGLSCPVPCSEDLCTDQLQSVCSNGPITGPLQALLR